VNDIMITGATTFPVPGCIRTVEAAGARRMVAPVSTVQGTGLPIGTCKGAALSVRTLERTRLPFAGASAYLDGVMGVDRVQAAVVRIPAVADQGDPPRRTPSRC